MTSRTSSRCQRSRRQRLVPPGLFLLWAGLWLAPLVSSGGTHFQPIKSFGLPAQAGAAPNALIEGTDGMLYGTTRAAAGAVFKLRKDGTGYLALHQFAPQGAEGLRPQDAVLEGSDGALYGTTQSGGTYSGGTLFKINKDGTGFRVLHHFAGSSLDGSSPAAALVEGRDHKLYGTCVRGGSHSAGTVFGLNHDGSGYTILHHFGFNAEDGQQPRAALVEGSDGALYGTTEAGGINSAGTVFRLNHDGSGYAVLRHFQTTERDGRGPRAPLLEASDGRLYGTTCFGGTNGYGTVFRLNKDGSEYRLLHDCPGFSSQDVNPQSALVEGQDGALYGAAWWGGYGGDYFDAAVFKLNKDGTGFSLVKQLGLVLRGDGNQPGATVLEASDGALYGTAITGGASMEGSVFTLHRSGELYREVYSFRKSGSDGASPGSVRVGTDGALYGVALKGGTNLGGALFQLQPDGQDYRLLYHFRQYLGINAEVVQGRDGAFYGSTSWGGYYGDGTVFRLSKDGSSFTNVLECRDANGRNPDSGPLEGADGALYVTALNGGSNHTGTIFAVNKDGSGFRVLRHLEPTEGPLYFGLMQGRDGALYGVTTYDGVYRHGAVFSLATNGSQWATLYDFGRQGPWDGAWPYSTLLEGTDGALYGTTIHGGTNRFGTIFRVDKDGRNYQILHQFNATPEDGKSPWSPLIEGRDGALYGAVEQGGLEDAGILFRIEKNGSGYTILHQFRPSIGDGGNPTGALALGPDGAFYGVTQRGGDLDCGLLFRLLPPQTPELLAARAGTNSVQVSFSGLRGCQYRLLRSADLKQWSPVATLTMPITGIGIYEDNSPPAAGAFYRAAWVP